LKRKLLQSPPPSAKRRRIAIEAVEAACESGKINRDEKKAALRAIRDDSKRADEYFRSTLMMNAEDTDLATLGQRIADSYD